MNHLPQAISSLPAAVGEGPLPALPESLAAAPGRLLLLAAPHAAAAPMLALSAELAHRGRRVHVLDCGNRFNAYIVARRLRQLAYHPTPALPKTSFWGEGKSDPLERITLQRAFSCYQVVALLEAQRAGSSLPAGETAPALLVLDLLDSFYDETVPLVERRRLAQVAVASLRELVEGAAPGSGRAVAVSLRPPPPGQVDSSGLQAILLAAADVLWVDPGLLSPAAGSTPPPGEATAAQGLAQPQQIPLL